MSLVGRENQKGRCSQRMVGAQEGQLTKICSARNACLQQSQKYLNLPKTCHTYRHQQPLHHEKIRMFHSYITKVFGIFVLKCCCIWDFSSVEQVSLYPLLSGAFSVGHSRKSSLFPSSFECRDTDSFLLWAENEKLKKSNLLSKTWHWHWHPHPRHRVCIGFKWRPHKPHPHAPLSTPVLSPLENGNFWVIPFLASFSLFASLH